MHVLFGHEFLEKLRIWVALIGRLFDGIGRQFRISYRRPPQEQY